MATSLPQMLSRSARCCRTVAAPSSSIASTSRCFTTTAPQQGPKAKAAGHKPRAKTRTLKVAKTGGSRGPKRGGAGDNDLSQLDLANQFHRPPKDMEHLPTLAADSMTLSKNLNAIMAYSDHHLAAFGKFGLEGKVTKNLQSYLRPVTLIRSETMKLVSRLEAAASPDSQPARIALTGPVSSGKSHLLLQAATYALSSNWLVLYLPRLTNFVDASSGFAYSEKEQAYLQPQLVRSVLANILATNRKALQQIKVNDGKGTAEFEIQSGLKVDATSTLDQLLDTASHSAISDGALQRIFDLFLASISQQTAVPVLVALDHAQALYQMSRYVTADMEPIESYELAPVRSLIRFLGGWEGQGVKRGAVVSSVSHSTTLFPVRDEMQVIINETAKTQGVSLQKHRDISSHANIHDLHLQHAKACLANTTITDLSAVWSREELKALYELRRQEGRNWNGGNADEADRRKQMMQSVIDAYPSLPGQPAGVVSEDELFLMRVLDSGGNPARFEASIRGSSAI